MSKTQTPKDMLEQLIEAISRERGKEIDYATLAHEFGLRRQFLYDIRDGICRTATLDGAVVFADNDDRYHKIDDACRSHGITGFIEAAEKAQRNRPVRKTTVERGTAHRTYERLLECLGNALDDPTVSELTMQLVNRVRELEGTDIAHAPA